MSVAILAPADKESTQKPVTVMVAGLWPCHGVVGCVLLPGPSREPPGSMVFVAEATLEAF